ncbi:MAG: 50S ribosomal protein L18a [Thermoplasmata archaeon]|jgi:ribosomal protein L20A (L18A)|nr:50S ribosomal protein L18a [Thermoplasmata archaeon]
MARWAVKGSFLARRGDWQVFTKTCDAASADQAKEWAFSEIGGCHGVGRRLIRIASISEVAA